MADTVSKAQLIDALADKHGLSKKDVKAVVEATFEHISEHLRCGDKVQLTGFGAFEVRDRQARMGVRPGTKERVQIPASKSPAFKPGKTLKDSVNS